MITRSDPASANSADQHPSLATNNQTPTGRDTLPDLSERLSALRQPLSGNGSVLWLHLGHDETIVVRLEANGQSTEQRLPVGIRQLAADRFHSALPPPVALENAIMVVEDTLVPARQLIRADNSTTELHSSDAAFWQIAAIAGISNKTVAKLGRDAVEQVFNRLVAVLEGRPARLEGLPEKAEFAAALLILREFLHHMDFAAIHLSE